MATFPFENEPIIGAEEARDLILDPKFTGLVLAHAEETSERAPRILPGVVSRTEFAIAERFGCTPNQKDGTPKINFGYDATWNSVHGVYNSTVHTSPAELYIGLEIDAEHVVSNLWVPLAALGKNRQAVIGRYDYAPRIREPKDESGSPIISLSKNGKTPKVGPNPFFEKPDGTEESALTRITAQGIVGKSLRGGRLGTV